MSESERSRLESASNIIDNARYFIEKEERDIAQQARSARSGWDMFAEELAAKMLAVGLSWDDVDATGLTIEPHVRSSVEKRAEDLRAGEGE